MAVRGLLDGGSVTVRRMRAFIPSSGMIRIACSREGLYARNRMTNRGGAYINPVTIWGEKGKDSLCWLILEGARLVHVMPSVHVQLCNRD